MTRELPYFRIGNAFGGSQAWMRDPTMKAGGCGALTIAETCIVLAKEFGATGLVPFDPAEVTKQEYIAFGQSLRTYMPPRWTGINRLETLAEEAQVFFDDREKATGEQPVAGIRCLHKQTDAAEAAAQIRAQIDKGVPLPMLTLHHRDKQFRDYLYHWYMLTGYRMNEDGTMDVKASTYGKFRWLPFEALWDTGNPTEDGGVLLIDPA